MMIVVMMMVTMIKMTIMTIVIMVMMSMIFVVMLSTTQSRMWIIIIVSGAFPGAPRHPSGAEPRKFAARENAQFGTVGGKNPAPLCNSRVSALVLPYLILLSFCGRATGGVKWKKSCTRGAMLNIEAGGPRGTSRSIAHCSVLIQVVQDFFHQPTQAYHFKCFFETEFGIDFVRSPGRGHILDAPRAFGSGRAKATLGVQWTYSGRAVDVQWTYSGRTVDVQWTMGKHEVFAIRKKNHF